MLIRRVMFFLLFLKCIFIFENNVYFVHTQLLSPTTILNLTWTNFQLMLLLQPLRSVAIWWLIHLTKTQNIRLAKPDNQTSPKNSPKTTTQYIPRIHKIHNLHSHFVH